MDPEEDFEKETSIFDHLASNIFIFVMALILLIVAMIVIMLLFKGAKMQALITNLAMQKGRYKITKKQSMGYIRNRLEKCYNNSKWKCY